MTVYATQTDVESAIGVEMLITISDRDHNNVVDAGAVTRALSEASSLMATYLPSDPDPIPDVVRRFCVDIAVHRLRIGTDNTTDDSRLAYTQAIAWLERVAAGAVVVPGTPDPDPGDGVLDPGDPQMEAEDKVWTRSIGIASY